MRRFYTISSLEDETFGTEEDAIAAWKARRPEYLLGDEEWISAYNVGEDRIAHTAWTRVLVRDVRAKRLPYGSLHGIIVEHNGSLCVKYSYNSETVPEIVSIYYLAERIVGNAYHSTRPGVGDRASYSSGGWWSTYSDKYGSTGSVWGDGNAPAFHVERTPVAPPKVRAGIETRWTSKGWEKLLKKGWVSV